MKYNVLLVDDRIDFAFEFIKTAKTYDITIIHKTNYKDMVDVLSTISGKIVCIILDIKCFLEPDQEIEREDFLLKALSHLDQQYRDIPRVILTADDRGYEDVKKYSSDEKIYRKTNPDIIALYQYIQSLDSDKIKIRSTYANIFQIIDKSPIPDEIEVQFIELIKKSESNDYSQILSNLGTIRRIQESVFQSINKTNKDIIPDDLLKNNKDIKFRDIHRHLKGNPGF